MSENLLDQCNYFEEKELPSGPIKVHRVRTKAAREKFLDFGYKLFEDNPFFTPPPKRDTRVLLDPLRHPFHEHADVEYFLAVREGKIVGRVAAIDNYAHRDFHDEQVGFFGFLDAIDDKDIFAVLLDTAKDWLKKRGLEEMRGPCNFSTNEECGCLVDAFQTPPAIMTPWNPEYYQKQFEAYGLEKAEDLLCYWIARNELPKRLFRIAKKAVQRLEAQGHTVTIRNLDKSRWSEEVEHIKKLYNKAWEKNWGFIPLTENEMDFIAKEMKLIVDPNLIVFVEIDGETAGFELTLPDYSELLRHMKGRLGPKEIATALVLKNQLHRARMLMMGVLPEFRNKGFELMMYAQQYFYWKEKGIGGGELSWILERNEVMNKILRSINAKHYRTYRIYQQKL